MKKLLFLIFAFLLTTQTIKAQVVLDANGVTIKWTGTTVPSPYFIQASPRGTLEWFAIVSDATKGNINSYAKNVQLGKNYFTPPGRLTPVPFNNIVTTLVTDMNSWFNYASVFNQPIDSWDVSNVTDMSLMFYRASAFNQLISSWNVSNVTDMDSMFTSTKFNQNISSWNVSNVTKMTSMFNQATSFNQNISSWNVSKVTDMSFMFRQARLFNQNISSWNVSNVTDMSYMFQLAAFNQPIDSWNVSKVTDMAFMFNQATSFNQPLGSWDVSNVTDMSYTFYKASSFNQPIGNWDVGNVTSMINMIRDSKLSIANYDTLLTGWSTITSAETPLKQGVVFDAGSSKYCKGASARDSLISKYGWTITDGGFDCTISGVEELEESKLKLYPNPVESILNINIDYNLIDEPYAIFDNLGRVVLEGKFKEVESTINLKELSKGIYYLKVSNSHSSKFIKE